ncbi:hypothetical protein [Acinetobacter proteolyticus]|uniref:hypothetical protein n=1 Tax=Acinetobacter proteolyticus TaxID=1776741 RepID=UPI0031D8CD12
MTTQTDRIKEEFAKRLHQGMDLAGYPVRGRARVLSREFGISDKGAGKWLNGEAIPETSKIPHLAKFLKVNAEWLLTGIDNLQYEIENPDNAINKELQNKDLKEIFESLKNLDANGKLSPNLADAIKAIIKLSINS